MKKMKYYIFVVAGVFLLVFGFCFIKGVSISQGVMRTLPYLCIGVGCGMFGYGLGEILSKKARQKHPEIAKRLDIEKNDERNILYLNAAKAKGFSMMTYVLGALMLMYLLMGASIEIILPLVIIYLFIHFYVIYHRLKMNKEH